MTYWDIMEVMTANEWLDIKDDQAHLDAQHQKAKDDARRGHKR